MKNGLQPDSPRPSCCQGGQAGLNARLELARMRLRSANGTRTLDQQAEALEQLVEFGGPAGAEAARLALATRSVAAARDSVTPGAPQGDLRLFLSGSSHATPRRDSAQRLNCSSGYRRIGPNRPSRPRRSSLWPGSNPTARIPSFKW